MSRERSSILVVDDASDTLEVIQRQLEDAGFEALTAPGVMEALCILEARAVDLVVTDLKMPKVNGLDLVRHVRENCQDTAVVVITGYPSVEGAVEAIKAGAENFLPKPFSGAELLVAVKGAMDRLRGRRVLQSHRDAPPLRPGMIGASAAMRRVMRAIERCAASDGPLLIAGPRGTGKKLAARTIHYSSSRAAEPFIPLDLAAVPDEQAERELFGGAGAEAGGLLAAVRAGTLYLDSIERATPSLQAALLRIVETGGRSSARVIGASTESVIALARQADARRALRVASPGSADAPGSLLHRLAATSIELPALRDRGDDVLALAAHFASQAGARAGRPPPRFSDEAIAVLRSYSWPGQVSELQGLVEDLVLSGGTSVDVTDLPQPMRFSVARERAVLRPLADVELEHIENVMAAVGGNRSRAAEILGINRKTLREKIKHRAAGESDPDGETD